MNCVLEYSVFTQETRARSRRRVGITFEINRGRVLLLVFYNISGCRKPIVGIQRVCARTPFSVSVFNILLLFSLASSHGRAGPRRRSTRSGFLHFFFSPVPTPLAARPAAGPSSFAGAVRTRADATERWAGAHERKRSSQRRRRAHNNIK